jgi:hypothetical protein
MIPLNAILFSEKGVEWAKRIKSYSFILCINLLYKGIFVIIEGIENWQKKTVMELNKLSRKLIIFLHIKHTLKSCLLG